MDHQSEGTLIHVVCQQNLIRQGGFYRVVLSAFSGRGFGPLAGLTWYSAPFGLQGDGDKSARIRPPITRRFGRWICA